MLQLSYEHGLPCHDKTVFRRTVIMFVCDLDEDIGKPEFLHEDNNCLYIFQWRTQAACKQPIAHCGAIDPNTGAEYHLDALMRHEYSISVYDRGSSSSSNWLALDNDDNPENADYAFRINVCRPLVADSSITCGPFAGICQTDLTHGKHFTIGYPLSPPEIVDGRLQLKYTDGQQCGKYQRQAIIRFSCSDVPGHLGTPVFDFEGDECNYYFSWTTSAACPQGGSQAATTSTTAPGDTEAGCKITNKVTGELFDLSSLGTDGFLHTRAKGSTGDEYDFYVGICKESSQADVEGCRGAGACQRGSSNLAVNLGVASQHLRYEGDQMILRYTDGALCHKKYSRQTTLYFMCDRSETGRPRLEYVEETDECDYRFEVFTHLVCAQTVMTPCVAIDFADAGGPQTFDLSPLMQTEADYSVEIPGSHSGSGQMEIIEINVCRSLVKPAAGCEGPYAACMSASGQRTGRPLGEPVSPRVTTDHQLRIDYVMKGCSSHYSSTTNTSIVFKCSSDGREHQPTLVSDASTRACSYLIIWETPLACTTTQPPPPPPPPGDLTRDDCVIANEFDRFDLSKLSPATVKNNNQYNGGFYTYRVSVCENIACGNTVAAVCQESDQNSKSLGLFTRKPILAMGHKDQVELLYEDGSRCDDGQIAKSRITFVCERDPSRAGLVFEAKTSHCQYEFIWYTDVVCNKPDIPHHELSCSLVEPSTGRVYRLDALIRSNSMGKNWLARDAAQSEDSSKNFNFYINVCRPLVPAEIDDGELSETCRGSAVCQMVGDNKAYSAGYAAHEPQFSADGDVILHYSLPNTYPSKCHQQFTRSASIQFTCKLGTLGNPVFVGETDECEYQFLWETSVVCDYKEEKGDDCIVTDPDTDTIYDLTPLQGLLRTVTVDGYKYELTVCTVKDDSLFSGCSGEGVGACQSKQGASYNLGLVNNQPFFTSSGIGLEYTQGQRCHNGQFERSTFIEFVCDRNAGDGNPEFIDELDDCSYVFRWPTSHVCVEQTDFPCVLTDKEGRQYDLSPLKRLDSNWMVDNVGQADEFVYILNVCHNIIATGAAAKCKGNAGACQWSSDQKNYYNLGHPTEPTFIDGKLQMYLVGGTPCNGEPRTTVVTFKCKPPDGTGQPLGTPWFDHEDQCKYNIVWQTSAACPVEVHPEIPTDSCVFEDDVSGTIFDLSKLSPDVLTFEDKSSVFEYSFSPCHMTPCGSTQSFTCQKTPKSDFSLGSKKSVSVVDGSIIMHLTGGTKCPVINGEREAFIYFECAVSL